MWADQNRKRKVVSTDIAFKVPKCLPIWYFTMRNKALKHESYILNMCTNNHTLYLDDNGDIWLQMMN